MREKVERVVKMAGEMALSMQREGLKIENKSDNTPVTNADKAVSDFLIAALQALDPAAGFLSEENPDTSGMLAARFWVIDPIDGTKHYMAGKDSWCVMVALVAKEPLLSVMYYPAHDTWFIAEKGKGAIRRSKEGERVLLIREPTIPPLIHRSKTTEYTVGELSSSGTVKHLLAVARGEIDCFVQSEREYWDVCPPALVLTEAGGVVLDLSGKPLKIVSKTHLFKGFIAGHPAVCKAVAKAIKKIPK